jgi:F0F1-type ATP synthase membrane subunit b/b'
MNFKQRLQAAIASIEQEKGTVEEQLKKLEEDFANIKLNPYGITSIDFTKRQDLTTDLIKMEGTIMGLQLAIEQFEEAESANI